MSLHFAEVVTPAVEVMRLVIRAAVRALVELGPRVEGGGRVFVIGVGEGGGGGEGRAN